MPKYTSVLALLLTIFVDALGWGLIFPSLTPLLIGNSSGIFASSVSLTSRNMQFEWVVALYSLFMLIGAPILSSLSDQLGRKPILRLCLAGSTLSYVIAALGVYANSLSLIILSRIIGGLTAGSMPIAQSALLDTSLYTNQKAQRLSWVSLASNLGFACGPVLGAVILGNDTSLFAYSLPFWWGAILAIAGLALICFCFQETLTTQRSPLRWRAYVNLNDFAAIIQDRKNRPFWLMLLLSLIAYSGFMAMLPIYFNHHHYSAKLLGYSMTWFALCNGLSLLLVLPRSLTFLSLKHLSYIGLSGAMIGNLLFLVNGDFNYLMIIISLIAIASPFSYIGLVTHIANHHGADQQGKVMGLAGSLMALSWIIAPLLAGFSTRSSYHLIYQIHAGLLALCLGYLCTKYTTN